MPPAGEMTHRVKFERLDDATKTWGLFGTAWAAIDGDGETYRVRMRAGSVPSLQSRASLEPTVRMTYLSGGLMAENSILDVTAASTTRAGVEVQLTASMRIIDEGLEDLATGTRRIKAWP